METAVKIFDLQKPPGSILVYKLFLPKLQGKEVFLQKMFQGGKKGKPPTNFTKFMTNLVIKLEKYSAIKDNYRLILQNY